MGDPTQDKPQPDRLLVNEVDPGKRYSVEDIANARYFQLPKFLFQGEFANLSNDAKVLYALLLDRQKQAVRNGWVNENGEGYLICSRNEMAEILGCSQPTLRKVLQELKDLRLIEEKRVGLNQVNHIYLLQRTSDPASGSRDKTGYAGEVFSSAQVTPLRNRHQTEWPDSTGCGMPAGVVFKDPRISTGAKALYAYIGLYAGSGGEANIDRDTICRDLNINKDTYQKYLRELIRFDYVRVIKERCQGRFATNSFVIVKTPNPCLEGGGK